MLAPLLITVAALASANAETGTVRLVSSLSNIQPGRPFKVGVLLQPAPGWHTYWVNSGDSGAPTSVEWHLPSGWSAGPVQFPAPDRIVTGGIVSYGYEKPTLLVDTLTPPSSLKPQPRLALKGRVRWLTCTPETCKIAKGEFSLSLPVSTLAEADATWQSRLDRAAAETPRPLTGYGIQATLEPGEVVLTVRGSPLLERPGRPYFFPEQAGMISHSKTQIYSFRASGMVAHLPLSEDSSKPPTRLVGVLKAPPGDRIAGGRDAVLIDVPIGNAQGNTSKNRATGD